MILRKSTNSIFALLAASIAIGIADNSAFFFFHMGLLSDAGAYWMLGALFSWMALFVAGMMLLRFRSLWLLLGLPLVLVPFALATYAAGTI
jgi:hypothetical protein